ncbi:Cupin domain protein [Pseudooceanicola marinus]|uniref:Cupin domain protein n=1 Tax=Pseudooceanicola marinus TaxID=396013 RepID=A0A1X6Z100_9RHOB|nr:cupin domain-containing protein [Pseudooceanicola marinus]PJE32504.1 cupin domain-containing protein [Pseudooceanicola marinus]SLN36786.1 Cupin domain protein [Pseudooceanicola marinus]
MTFPDFIMGFPALDVPFPEDVVQTRAVQSEAGLVIFFTFLQDMVLPPHAHGPQWGTVVEGEITLTIDGETRTYAPGESYDIPDGALHGARIKAGTKVIDVFAEADRYALKG